MQLSLQHYQSAHKHFVSYLKQQNSELRFSDKTTDISEHIQMCLEAEHPEIKRRILNEYVGLGPLDALIKKPDIDEIIVMGHETIIYECRGTLFKYEDQFLSERAFLRVIDLISNSFFKAVSYENPTGNGHWQDYRVHIIAPPLCPVYNLSLRKKGSSRIKNFSELLRLETLSESQLQLLLNLLNQKKNILVSGATSSGKTTFIQCLLNEVTKDRCLIIEDAQELNLPNTFSTRLLCPTRTEQYELKLTMSDLVKESLRMRPDRLILGEARGGEAKDYIQALSTGHKGCIASIHAANPQEALLRLECLILQGAPEWSTKVVKQLIHSSIDYIVQLEKSEEGQRRITDIQRISCLEEGHVSLEPAVFT